MFFDSIWDEEAVAQCRRYRTGALSKEKHTVYCFDSVARFRLLCNFALNGFTLFLQGKVRTGWFLWALDIFMLSDIACADNTVTEYYFFLYSHYIILAMYSKQSWILVSFNLLKYVLENWEEKLIKRQIIWLRLRGLRHFGHQKNSYQETISSVN